MKKMIQAQSLQVATDTASIAVFDPYALSHRLKDAPDWWCRPGTELNELNAGNMVILGLGSDGLYEVSVQSTGASAHQSALIRVVSGKIFIGQGEQITSDGFYPDVNLGGTELTVPVAIHRISWNRKANRITIGIEQTVEQFAENSFSVPIYLEMVV